MDSTFIHQKANELVLRAGSRDLHTIAKTVGIDVTEMPFDAISGFFTFKWDLYQVVINAALDRQTKQMVCGYALSRYAETYLFSCPPFAWFPFGPVISKYSKLGQAKVPVLF